MKKGFQLNQLKPYSWSRGELNPGPVTVPSIFYMLILLTVR